MQEENQDPEKDLSSVKPESTQMKNIYIELDDYSYYHQPSNVKDKDERHLGRKKFHEKLKSIIVDSAQQTGAYLITGYRGMGKTSLVNNVLNDIKSSEVSSIRKWIITNFRILFLLVPFAAIDFEYATYFYLGLIPFLIILGLVVFSSQTILSKSNKIGLYAK